MNTVLETHPALKNGATFLKEITGLTPKTTSMKQTTISPLAPAKVTAKRKDSIITIEMTVYIDASDKLSSLDVYTRPTFITSEGATIEYIKPIYIVYKHNEIVPKKLSAYNLSFTITDTNSKLNYIQSFLYDSDPISSSGTKTTVKDVM